MDPITLEILAEYDARSRTEWTLMANLPAAELAAREWN